MPAPSVVVYKDAYAATSAATNALTQRTVATGDVVAVVVQIEDNSVTASSLAKTAGTATIGTVTKQRDAGTASHCGNVLFTFTVTAGGTLTLTVTWASTPTSRHFTAWTYVATGCGGVGNTAMTTTSTTTITASLATSANSYVLALAADWNAAGGATTTLTPAGGVLDAHETDGVADQVANGNFFSSRGGHWASVSAGTVSYGVSVPTSAAYNLVVCELLAGAGGQSSVPQLTPPGRQSPAAWSRLRVPPQSPAAPVVPPPVIGPATPHPVPPGRQSPMAWGRLVAPQPGQPAPPPPPVPPAYTSVPGQAKPGKFTPGASSPALPPAPSPPSYGAPPPVPPGRQSPSAWSRLGVPRVPQAPAAAAPAAVAVVRQLPLPRRVPAGRARTGRGLVAAGLIGTIGVTSGVTPSPGLPRIGHPAPHRALWRGSGPGGAPGVAQQVHVPPRFAQRVPHRALWQGSAAGAAPNVAQQVKVPVTVFARKPHGAAWRGGQGTVPAALPQPFRPATVYVRAAHRAQWRGGAGTAVAAVQGGGVPQPFKPATVFRRTPHLAAWRAVTGQPPAAARQPFRPPTVFTRAGRRVLWRGGQGPAVVSAQGTGLPQPFRPPTVFRRVAHGVLWRAGRGVPPAAPAQPTRPVTVFRRAVHRAAWQAGAGKPPAAARQPFRPVTVWARAAHRVLWRAVAGPPPGPPPAFTVGALTAVTAGAAAVAASAAADAPAGILSPADAAGATLTASVMPGASASSAVGAYVSNMYGATGNFTAQRALFAALTGTTIGVTRYYKALSDFTYDASMQLMVAAGVKMCLTLRPAYNPVSAGDLASMTTLLATLQAAGARVDVALWHEPYFGGLSAAQFTAMIAYYGPAVRTYYPLVFVGSGPDTILGNGYYPGDAAVDKIAADQYAFGTVSPDPGSSIDNCAAIADAAVPPKPLGLWEFNGSTDLVTGQSQAFVTTWLGNVQSFFTARVAAGKPNADILLFDSGTGNFLGNATNANCGFEGGIGTWVFNANCAVAPTSAQVYEGTGALRVTAAAAGNMSAGSCSGATIVANGLPCAPGDTVVAGGQFRAAAVTRGVRLGVQWFTAAGGFISTSTAGTAPSDATTGWTALSATFTAPGTTGRARMFVQWEIPGGAGEVHYADNAFMYVAQPANSLTTTIWSGKDYRVALFGALAAAMNAAPVLSSQDAAAALLSARTTP